jgi:hypothetical protein
MNKVLFFVSILFIGLVACEKQEGRGGSSTIKGLVMVQEYDKDLIIAKGDPYPAQDVDVYLIYGDDEIYGDKFQTGHDGKYEFKYLQTGVYSVYVLSKSLDNRITDERVPVFKKVEITAKNQIVEVENIDIID